MRVRGFSPYPSTVQMRLPCMDSSYEIDGGSSRRIQYLGYCSCCPGTMILLDEDLVTRTRAEENFGEEFACASRSHKIP